MEMVTEESQFALRIRFTLIYIIIQRIWVSIFFNRNHLCYKAVDRKHNGETKCDSSYARDRNNDNTSGSLMRLRDSNG